MDNLILNIEKILSYDDFRKEKIIKLLEYNIIKDGYDEISYNTLEAYGVFKSYQKEDLGLVYRSNSTEDKNN